ncbi:MAG: DNA translocase FtsK [Candidatus Aminicenantaceae bacterium]
MKRRKKREITRFSLKSKRKKRVITYEIIGILLFFFAVFTFLSLISYNSSDPSWASVTSPNQKIHNYCGRIGSFFSEALLQFLGLASFFIPFAFLYLGMYFVFSKERRRYSIKIGGFVFLVLILSSLLFILFKDFSWRGIGAGGLIGEVSSVLLIRYFNHTGSLIFLIALFILFFFLSTGISFGKTTSLAFKFFSFIFKGLRIRVVRYQKSKSKEKMRKRVIEKYSALDEKQERRKYEEEIKQRRKKEKRKLHKELVLSKPQAPPVVQKPLFRETERKGDYLFPPFSLLDPGKAHEKIDKNELYEKKQQIEEKLREFRVDGEVREYHPGPIITTYEFHPFAGIKVSQVANLTEELSLALRAESVRVQRIPGKSTLGIEIPNNKREIIKLRDVIQSEKFMKSPSKLALALGKNVHGDVYISDLSIMPHLLIAGATGTGKSVALHSIIASILYKATPEEVKLILIDPKRLEFGIYNGIPHLLSPVIRDAKKAGAVLLDAVKKMDERYRKLGLLNARDIDQYNNRIKQILQKEKGKLTEEERERIRPLPYYVIIIDELAELMMIGAQEVEQCIARLAQLARAVGIHLIMATQRPSIDVITGTIKNNFSSRIAFRVPSKIDSRIILDTAGADKLLGLGDMLFMPPNYPRLIRLHCSYISVPEASRLVKFVKEHGSPTYDEKIVKVIETSAQESWEESREKDELYNKAVELILLTGQASASYLQRKLKLGYARAARIIDQMELEGIVGPSEGSKPREILVDARSYLSRRREEH